MEKQLPQQPSLSRRLSNQIERFYRFPFWAAFIIALGLYIASLIANDEIYSNIFNQLTEGITMTLTVSLIAYSIAFVFGMLIGLLRSSPPKPGHGLVGGVLSFLRMILYNIATFYVEVLRGLPILVVLLMTAFVIFPFVRDEILDGIFGIRLDIRGGSPVPAIFALTLTYSAFMSETFRAGIQSIERGQMEAARSLGMTYFQAMRHVILPQAIRRILPPLGNDFIAMLKDSSLVSVLGIRDVTQIARISSGRSFRYVETYVTLALVYLTMTLIGSQLVRLMERRLKQDMRQAGSSVTLWTRLSRFGRGNGEPR